MRSFVYINAVINKARVIKVEQLKRLMLFTTVAFPCLFSVNDCMCYT